MDEIFYRCDRKKCNNCTPECLLTTDITHAKDFKRNILRDYIQKEPEIIEMNGVMYEVLGVIKCE